MNVIFTCGGTGGHINPAISVAKLLLARHPEANILFVGAEDGMEKDLVPREGFRLETLKISNYQRSFTPKAICHNVATLFHMGGSMRKADRIIRDFRPDVILGTGGYASFPMLKRGAKLGIPTAVHEANAVPGLTTRMVEAGADRILVCFDESRSYYQNPDRVEVVGMPVREEFLYTDRAEARKALGLDERPLVISAWGSLGAREMNKKITSFMALECQAGEPFQHIHATGSYGWRWMPDYVRQAGVDLSKHPSIQMKEYIYNMPQLMAAADLIITRAGASTLSEIQASATPCIIVPSPNVTDNHQEKNARVLEKAGGAKVFLEGEFDAASLLQTVRKLLADREALDGMSAAMKSLSVPLATERICDEILKLCREE